MDFTLPVMLETFQWDQLVKSNRESLLRQDEQNYILNTAL